MSTTRKWLAIAGSLLLMLIFIAVVIRHNREVAKSFGSSPVAVATPAVKPLPSRTFERLRAVHYFADVHPVQFWNSFEPADVERDFSQIRADGFNSIVLILPWAEFQPSLEDGKHDERMFDRLSLLMAAAEKLHLGVVLRVSYFWTYRPGAEREIHSRVHGLFHDDRIRAAWLGHLAEIYRRVGQHPAFRLAFLSWEDLYPMEIASASAVLRDEKILREYRKYLARTSALDEVSALYGQRFANWESVPFPNRKSAAYAKVFDYWDDALLNRLFAPANERFPNLSFEVRSDSDPIWGKDDKMIWKNHSATYTLPGTNTLTTYYATAWGMKNEGDLASAEEMLKQFDRFVDHVKEKNPRHHLFIDQFLFYYSIPRFYRNTQIKPEERDLFLEGIGRKFREEDISYALWYYRDYVDSVLYNAHFSLGLDGWQASAGARMAVLDSGRNAVTLDKGSRISQRVPAALRGGWNVFDKPFHVCATRGANINSTLRGEASSGVQQVMLVWRAGEKRACQKIRIASDFELSLLASRESLTIDQVELFSILEPSAIYDRDGKPGAQLAAIRKLNTLVAIDFQPGKAVAHELARTEK